MASTDRSRSHGELELECGPALHEAEGIGKAAVPFVDLSPSHRSVRNSLLVAIGELIDSGAFTNGPHVAEFEEAFARFCGSCFCVGVGSGLDALRLALLGLALDPGSEVILPANTFIATAEAIVQSGLTPVFVDVSERDRNIDPAAVEQATTSRTRAVLPVHLYGQMADMRPLIDHARKHGLLVVEDACQAHAATRDGLRAGTAGNAGAFSFYPGKNLGAFGDAGALVTNDADLSGRVRALREHGQVAKYEHESPGYTTRLDTIQALVLLKKLPMLAAWTEERRTAAASYTRAFTDVGDIRLPPVAAGSKPVWHLYAIRTAHRNQLANYLRKRGIATECHYPTPLHLTKAFAHLGYRKGAFPTSEALSDELLSLPLFPGIGDERIGLVTQAIKDFFSHA